MREESNRLSAVDHCRGMIILGMVIFNYVGSYKLAPPPMRHAGDVGLTIADVGAPLFLFIMGMMYRVSFVSRWKRDGVSKATLHMARRYTILLMIGLVPSVILRLIFRHRLEVGWGVIQTLGMAGLLALPTMRLKTIHRLVIGVALLVLYQLLLEYGYGFRTLVRFESHGGPVGSISWAGIVIVSSVLGDYLRGRTPVQILKTVALFAVSLIAAGLFMWHVLGWPVSKHQVSGSYSILTTGISAACFFMMVRVTDIRKWRWPFVAMLGRNPLVIFLLQLVLLIPLYFLVGLRSTSPIGWRYVGLAYVLAGTYLIGWWLERKKLYIKL